MKRNLERFDKIAHIDRILALLVQKNVDISTMLLDVEEENKDWFDKMSYKN